MANYHTNLDRAFSALADPTRRAIVSRLCEGPRSVGELAEPFDIALPSLLKHVQVLERSGLVVSEKAGRVRICRIEPGALEATEAWIRQHIRAWESRLDRMEAHIQRMTPKD
ncbi:ArsR/SmtB family transcription factor [Microvirga pudoricolor]|uniref:ArsR/SmtB family transcription factor n=1 Tax=Microvirga pudoricolor TaxID=2778729 RepID=UPI00194EE900|nr:metalloregulator ArsR/SmtB family transcription factor [Microvirga pudoricolor]MBM6593440.1 winged helix-turn-helix transcriptional regulator [Microvirga pudoricolor]